MVSIVTTTTTTALLFSWLCTTMRISLNLTSQPSNHWQPHATSNPPLGKTWQNLE